jgi:hypothetical protein
LHGRSCSSISLQRENSNLVREALSNYQKSSIWANGNIGCA